METNLAALPAVEGLTPSILWYTLVGIVGIAALFILYDKVRDIVKKRKKERDDAQNLTGMDITDRIAEKVEKKLEPKFKEIYDKFSDIDTKLSNDKEVIELHTRQLNAYEGRVGQLEGGNKALCHGVLALLSHEVNGNSIDKITRAHDAMKNYLIDGKYNDADWK